MNCVCPKCKSTNVIRYCDVTGLDITPPPAMPVSPNSLGCLSIGIVVLLFGRLAVDLFLSLFGSFTADIFFDLGVIGIFFLIRYIIMIPSMAKHSKAMKQWEKDMETYNSWKWCKDCKNIFQ